MTDPIVTDPNATDPTSPGAGGADGDRAPLVRWIRGLPQWLYAAVIVAAVVVLLLVAMVLNPGERVGPVRPASPPVGGPDLPATRL